MTESLRGNLTRRDAAAALIGGAALSFAPQALAGADRKIAILSDKFKDLKLAALIVSQNGKRIHAEGDLAKPYLLHSMRKSIINMLYGIAVQNGEIHLDDTLAKLNIDDIPALSDVEKRATVRHLLKARSGVYIPAAAQAPTMNARRPPRASHPPDTLCYYNNLAF